MLENSAFDNGIDINNNSNKNEFIKKSKIYSKILNKSIKRINNRFPKKKNFIFLLFGFCFVLLLFFFFKSRKKNDIENKLKKDKLSYTYDKPIIPIHKNDIIVKPSTKTLKQNENEKKLRNEKIADIYDKPILPFNKEDIIVKPYTKIYYNSSHLRYHFHDLFHNRKIFKINYNYLPYTKISKTKSFDENAKNIYESTGILNLTKLYIYYNNKYIDTSNFNHIHLGMGFDKNYIFLTTISMASILNTSSPDTYIHFHLVLINDIQYIDLKPIIDLKKINKNVEFVFYNGKQAEYDFGERAKKESRGVGDYTRILIPEIVNNTNKIIIIDSADIIAKKDLSQLYFFDIGDNYFAFSLENIAGKFHEYYIFGRNNFYPNSGICLTNVRKFREDNLYKNSFFSSLAYEHLPCPYQDIFLMISNYKFKYWPLNYNCPQCFNDNEKNLINYNSSAIYNWLFTLEIFPV
jgi:lipopolysaccharide biosynthesis glycosyltransferase